MTCKRRVNFLLLLAGTGVACFAADANDPAQSGPVSLVIQYRCLPGQRASFRQHLSSAGVQSFSQWQTDGMIADYHLLFSRYVDTNGWDALALVTFHRYSDVTRWRRVEATTPAGLPERILGMTTNVETYPVDLLRQSASSDRPLHPVYLVIPYTVTVAPPDYLQFFDDYAVPQWSGSIEEGILASYQLYRQRYTAARPWDALLLLQYKDDDAFGLREKVDAQTRARLQSNPGWKLASDSAQNVRVERQAIIADDLSVH